MAIDSVMYVTGLVCGELIYEVFICLVCLIPERKSKYRQSLLEGMGNAIDIKYLR
jgi:hypothetical protein